MTGDGVFAGRRWLLFTLACLALALPQLAAAQAPRIVVSQDAGGPPFVRVFDFGVGEFGNGMVYDPAFLGGVRVAVCDFNHDGHLDILTAPGPGMPPLVRGFDGQTATLLGELLVYDPAFLGGVFVACGDLTGDGVPDVVTGPDTGSPPLVRAFNGTNGALIGEGLVYEPGFLGGVRVAVCDFNGDGHADVMVAPGPGRAPLVRVFDGATAGLIREFLAFPESFTGGVYPACGDLNGDGVPDFVVGAGVGGVPVVRAFDGVTGAELGEGVVFAPDFTGGVRVAVCDLTGNGRADVLVGSGPGIVTEGRAFDGQTGAEIVSGIPFGAFTGGMFLACASPVAVQITSANATTFTVGVPGTFTITAVGLSPVTSIIQTGGLPAGVGFTDNGDGTATLAGTPQAGSAGVYHLELTATTVPGVSATQAFTLTVHELPAITSANATTFVVGQAGTFAVTTTGFPPPSIARGGAALPAGVTFVDNGDGTGTLSGTPGVGTGGTYAITFTASNAAGSTPAQSFALTVNEAPAITSASAVSFTIGMPGTFTVTTTGFPKPSVARGGVALPPLVTFVDNGDGTGTLSGTPNAGTGGTYALTFTASNGVPPDAVQNPFTLTVQLPPTAVADGPYVIDANTTLTRVTADADDLLDNDQLGAPPAGITSFGGGSLGGAVTDHAAGSTVTPLPQGSGSLTVQSTGAFTFTPPNGFTGVYTFQYRLANIAGSSDATVTINVRPKANNDVFGETVLGNVVVNTANGTAFSILTNDVFNGTPAVNTSGTSAQGGTVTVAVGGTFTYNPPVGYQGADSFTYTITDSSGLASTSATVSLTVNGIIWFINNNPGACSSNCNGRLTNPFPTLAGFTSVNTGVGLNPADNHNIFIFESASAYTSAVGTLLRQGQKLIGQDATASLATIAGVTPPTGSTLPAMNTAGNTSRIGSTVPLATNSTVRGLSIVTGALTGLSGGAVSGVTVAEVIVTTLTGTAVTLNGTGGTISLISVSANGAANGISLTNTTGSFTVTGDAGGANNGSGGTIQNTTGSGIVLVNVQNVSLEQLNISGTADSGINGNLVTNFSLVNSTITNAGNASFDSAVAFNGFNAGVGNNINGILTVTGNTFTNPFYSGLDVQSNNGTVTSANVSNNTISNPGFSGINFTGTGTASTRFNLNNATITQNSISGTVGNGIQISISNSNAAGPGATAGIPNDASNRINITNNSITAVDAGGTQAIAMAIAGGNTASRTQANFLIECNGKNTGGCTAPSASPLASSAQGTVVLIGNNGFATMTGTVNNNVIVATHTPNLGGGNGIGGGNGVAGAGNAWTPDLTLTVTNNTISGTDGNGILLVGRGATGLAKLKVASNTVSAPVNAGGSARQGIRVDAGNASSADDAVCLNISGNTSAGSNLASGIGVRKQGVVAGTNDFGLQGILQVAPTNTDVQNFVNAQDPAGGGTDIVSGSAYVQCNTAPL